MVNLIFLWKFIYFQINRVDVIVDDMFYVWIDGGKFCVNICNVCIDDVMFHASIFDIFYVRNDYGMCKQTFVIYFYVGIDVKCIIQTFVIYFMFKIINDWN